MPVRGSGGEWVVDNWSASQFIDGLDPLAPSWDRIIDVGRRFSTAGTEALDGSEHLLGNWTHQWAIADRVAWNELDVTLNDEATALLHELRGLLGPLPTAGRALIHGDLAGNVFVVPGGFPVVLDISPYLRPGMWVGALVIADAALWLGADLALASSFAGNDVDRDLLGRALIFRLVAEQLTQDEPAGVMLEPYRAVLEHVASKHLGR